LNLFARTKGRGWHFDRSAEPIPGRDDCCARQRKKNGPEAHRQSLLP
jgi:hypothetical protein